MHKEAKAALGHMIVILFHKLGLINDQMALKHHLDIEYWLKCSK